MRTKLVGMLALVALAGCGSISNEELQMLALLPDDSLGISAPADEGQALTSDEFASNSQGLGRLKLLPGAAAVAQGLNDFVNATLEHLGDVAKKRPTTRDGAKRVWGPVPLATGKGYVRVVLEKDPTAKCAGETEATDDGELRLRFAIELSGKRDGDFKGMVSGTAHGEFFDHSCGTMHFDRKIFKAFGGRGGLVDPDGVDLAWTRDAAAQTIETTLEGGDSGELAKGTAYRFVRRLDGGANELHFTRFEKVDADGTPDRIEVALQWTPGGREGRGDFRVERTLRGLLTGTACWNGSVRPYYADSEGNLESTLSVCGSFTALPLP